MCRRSCNDFEAAFINDGTDKDCARISASKEIAYDRIDRAMFTELLAKFSAACHLGSVQVAD